MDIEPSITWRHEVMNMLVVTSRQTQQLRDERRDVFVMDTETLLRDNFGSRLASVTSVDMRHAIRAGVSIGSTAGLTRQRDIQIYLACACVCGLYMFTDPRCYWLFGEGEERWSIEGGVGLDVERVAELLDLDGGVFFNENLMDDFECRVYAAEREFSCKKDLRSSLLMLTPERHEFIDGAYLTEFVDRVENLERLAEFDDYNSLRYTLVAWLFGVQFMDDPLCRSAQDFLRNEIRR